MENKTARGLPASLALVAIPRYIWETELFKGTSKEVLLNTRGPNGQLTKGFKKKEMQMKLRVKRTRVLGDSITTSKRCSHRGRGNGLSLSKGTQVKR